MRRIVWVVLALAAVAFVPVPGGAQEQVVITMYTGSPIGSVPNAALQEYLDLYMELNPHVRIENLGQEHNPDKLVTLFLTGEAPDIIEHDAAFIIEYYQRGFLAPVPEDLRKKAEEFFYPVSTYSVTLGDVMVGIPVESNAVGLWFSRQAMEEGGVTEVPRTVIELEQVARRLARVDSEGNLVRAGLAHSGDAPWAFTHTVLAFMIAEGGSVLDEEGRIALDSRPVLDTIVRLAGWLQVGDFFGFEPDWRSYSAFHRGEVPFGVGYPWWMQDQRQVYPGDYTQNFGVALLPGTESYGTVHYGHAYGVNRRSPHLDEVWRLLEWLSLESVDGITPLGAYHAAIGTLPVHRDDVAADHFAAERAVYQGFIDNLAYARTVTEWRRFGADPDMSQAVLSVANGEASPAQAVETLVRTTQAAMERYGELVRE